MEEAIKGNIVVKSESNKNLLILVKDHCNMVTLHCGKYDVIYFDLNPINKM